MQFLSISEVGRQVGLTPSAIRYYEQVGVIASTQRVHGQRCYDQDAVRRLAVVQHARRTGFSLKEIRQLFLGFPSDTIASERWQELAQAKQAELSATIEHIRMMQSLLTRLGERCDCSTLEQCGRGILKAGFTGPIEPLRSLKTS